MNEDTGNSVGGGGVAMEPTKSGKMARRESMKLFNVKPETFSKFQSGRSKYERWSKFFDESETDASEFARKNPGSTIVLRCSETGALRAIRRRSSCGT